MSDDNIPLGQALTGLRKELHTLVKSSEYEDLKFRVRDIEIELELQVDKQSVREGAVSAWSVVSGKRSNSQSRGQTHRVRLSLEVYQVDMDGKQGDVELASHVFEP